MNRSRKYLALALASALVLPSLARAEEEAPVGKLSLLATIDVVTEYMFRGYAGEDGGLIAQPAVTISLDHIVGGEGFSLSPYAGMWESLHSRQYIQRTPAGQPIRETSFYKHNFNLGLKWGLFGSDAKPAATLDFRFTSYTYPSGAADTNNEAGVILTLNDGNWGVYEDAGFGGLSPYIGWFGELNDTTPNTGLSDASNNGQYLEAGIAPSWAIDVGDADERGAKLILSIPMAVGLGINDYYYDSDGKDVPLGFGRIGGAVEVPFVTSDRWGNWSFTGSFTWWSLWADSLHDRAGREGDPGANVYIGQVGIKVTL